MAKIQQDILLSRINEEIKKRKARTISDLSQELQEDIEDTVPPEISYQGLKVTYVFLLEFIPKSARQYFKWPE